jgi:hypothetical protein
LARTVARHCSGVTVVDRWRLGCCFGISSGGALGADSGRVTGDGSDANDAAGSDRPAAGRLRAVQGALHGHEAVPSVRLLREWKGLCAADLVRLDLVERLPGQVRSALEHIENGDFAAAERALPGEFAPLLPGPGSAGRSRRSPWLVVGIVVALGAAALLANWVVG